MAKQIFRRRIFGGIVFLLLFGIIWWAVTFVDVQAIGPEGTRVGLATLNDAVQDVTGFQNIWYQATTIEGILALLTVACFGLLGLVQLVTRKSFAKVDLDLYFLAGCYVVMGALYVFFEKCIVNYRPMILDEGLEASFPSSHTMLVIVVFGTACFQIQKRISNEKLMRLLIFAMYLLMAIMVIGRLLSGVHWCTDVLAGLCLGYALVLFYGAFFCKAA